VLIYSCVQSKKRTCAPARKSEATAKSEVSGEDSMLSCPSMSPHKGRKAAKFSGAAADLTKVFPMVLFTVSDASIMPFLPISLLDFDDDDDDGDADPDVMSMRLGRCWTWDACIRMDDAPW
jgi:hypothetical protein